MEPPLKLLYSIVGLSYALRTFDTVRCDTFPAHWPDMYYIFLSPRAGFFLSLALSRAVAVYPYIPLFTP